MLKKNLLIGCLCLLLCLTACGEGSVAGPLPTETEAAPTAEPTPEVTIAPTPVLTLGGEVLFPDCEALVLRAPSEEDLASLCAAAPGLPALHSISAEDCVLTPQQVLALRGTFPEALFTYTVALFGQDCPCDLERLSLNGELPGGADKAFLPELDRLLPALTELDVTGGEEGELPALADLNALRSALPEQIALRCRFSLFDQILDSDMEEIIYEKAGLKTEDLEQVRQALPLLHCRRFVLDNCGPSYEALAALRDEFPDRGIVWRVHFMGDSLLTDDTVLWSIYVRDSNCYVLNYCTELEYIDLGHDESLTDISFTAHMPKLKVLIIAKTAVSDISPLANCPELEYLELFGTEVSDLSPLSGLKKLEHLNISTLFYLRDISPLYELTSLKRLRMVHSGGVPSSQMEEITSLLPDCNMMFDGEDPTGNGWRKDRHGELVERYALLREQIGYNGYNSAADKIDWDKAWQPGYAEGVRR